MNRTTLIIVGLLIVGLIAWGELRYKQGRVSMQNEILAQPVTRDTVHLPTHTEPVPPIIGSGPGVVSPNTPPRPTVGIEDTSVPYLVARIVALEEEVAYLRQPFFKTIEEGGIIANIGAYPEGRTISWVIQPPAKEIETVLVTETRYVPLERSKWAFTGYAAWKGAGLAVGYDGLGVGRLWMAGEKPITFLSYTGTVDFTSLF